MVISVGQGWKWSGGGGTFKGGGKNERKMETYVNKS